MAECSDRLSENHAAMIARQLAVFIDCLPTRPTDRYIGGE